MDNRTFLDIDDTIITESLRLRGNEQQNDHFMEQFDSKPSFIIQPTPGICIKFKTGDGEKAFLNLCTSDKIPAPEDVSVSKLFEIVSQKYPQFVIPMSIGTERLESDKGGTPCLTYDVVINTAYFDKCQKIKYFLLYTIPLVINGLISKFSRNFDPGKYVILKNRKVIGKLQQQRVENREPHIRPLTQKSLIEEIESPIKNFHENQTKSDKSDNSPSKVANQKLNYVLLKQPLQGTPKHLIGLFQTPKGITSEDVEVLIDENRIVITVDKTGLTYDLSVPCTINIAYVKCFLDKDLKVLRLDMPVKSVADNI